MTVPAISSSSFEALSAVESAELAQLERQIQRDIEAATPLFVQIATNLARIRDGRLYRAEFDDFGTYCRERWGRDRSTVYRLISAASVNENLAESAIGDTNGSPVILPMTESQMRPLARLRPEEQRQAWSKAVTDAGGGQPTAKQVKAAAALVAGREPTEVERARVAGIIPENAIVTIDASEVDDGDPEDPKAAEPQELSDAEWLETLPARRELSSSARSYFDIEAIAFRELTEDRRKWIARAKVVTDRVKREGRGRIGPWLVEHFAYVKLDDPSRWIACNECKDGDGLSTGQIPLVGDCPRCKGHAYYVPKSRHK